MKAVIPMAGYGKRLRPHTFSRPKPLINVAGEPMLKHVLDSLESLPIEEYIFIVGYLGEQIEEYVRAHYKVKATFVEQKEMIGQAHAIHLTKEHLSGPVIVLFADTLFDADLSVIGKTDADAMVFVHQVPDPRRFGVVVLDSDGKVTQFIEKPSSMENRNAVIGLYYIRDAARMLDAIEKQLARKVMTKDEYFIADAFQIMVEDGAVFRTQSVNTWLDCGKPETVLETNRYLLDHGHDNSSEVKQEGFIVVPPVHIHSSAVITNSIIGPHTTVGAGCHISDSLIRDSIIDAGADVKLSLLDQSLIGRDASVGGRYRVLNVGDESSVGFG
jgi:glucose-1-phosphate thymidylyltransferase